MTTRSEVAAARLEWAARQSAACRLCPRQCGAGRAAGRRGWCGAGAAPAYFQEFVNHSEEPELSPSHALLLTGCNLACRFCHTAAGLHDPAAARPLDATTLREIARRGRAAGARNLNLYGGDPGVNLPGLLRLFAAVPDAELPPVVWNTNLYAMADTVAAAAGLPALWLADLKFGNNACGARIAGVPDYWDVVRDRLRQVRRQEGAAKLLVRHLVLPGHVDCCTRPVLAWLAAALPGVRLSLRTSYLPMPAARADDRLGRFLTPGEASAARMAAAALGLPLVPGCETAREPLAESVPATHSTDVEVDMDAEFVFSPAGELFLRNAPRDMMRLARHLAGTDSAGPHQEPPA